MPRHIFKSRQDSPSMQQIITPKCHYHNNQITHFCIKKSCTLPLCKDCLPIHKIQHKNNNQTALQGIIQFQVAKNDSLAAFRLRKNEILAVQQQFTNKLMEYKKTIISLVDIIVNTFLQNSLTADGGLQILSEIEQKIIKIQSGSLKQLIQYYQDFYDPEKLRKMYSMYSGDQLNNLNYVVDEIKLAEIIRKNFNFTLNQNNEVLKRENDSQQNVFIENDNKLAYEVTFDVVKQRQSIKEEENQSSIESYQLFKSKIKQQSEYINSKRDNKFIDALPSHHSPHINQINEPQRNKNKKRKGLSLVKSHSQLPNSNVQVLRQKSYSQLPNRNQPKILQKSVNFTSESIFNKELNNNSSVKKRQSFPYKIAPQHIEVLNPKQMRELIAKRKTMQRDRRKQQLLKNNSNEIMTIFGPGYKS